MAKNIKRHIQHIKSAETDFVTVNGNDVVVAKLPQYEDLKDGEIAINYHDGYETISIRNDNNEIVTFPNINAVNTLIEEKAQDVLEFDDTPTAESTNPVTSEGIKDYVDTGDSIQEITTYQTSTPLAVGDTHDEALSKLVKIIDDNETTTARALTDLNDNKQDKITDLSTIRAGAALGATALQAETQLSKGATTGNGNVVTDINVNNHQITLTKGATALTEHQSIKTINGTSMVGTGNVSVGTITGITMNNVSKGTSGVVDLGTVVTSETQLSKGTTTGDGNAVTDISVSGHQITLTKGATFLEASDVANYADGVEYDSEEHLIYLKHGSTRLSNPIDATDFIKDGMVSSVRIDVLDVEDGSDDGSDNGSDEKYLIITFNTDAGQEDIEIPLSDIFDPNLYYTKAEIDQHELVTAAALTELHDTKQELLTFDYVPTSGSTNPVTSSGIKNYVDNAVGSLTISELVEPEASTPLAVGDTYDEAFAKLTKIIRDNEEVTARSLTDLNDNKVSREDIEGDYYTKAEIDDNSLVISSALNELNDTIEEIEETIQNIQPELDFDTTPTAGSDNPVTSGGIKNYVDTAIGSLGNIVELNEPSVSTPLAVGDTYDEAFAKLTKIIRDNELATSGALTELHNTKQELLTFDNVPTENSENVITSGAVYDALSNVSSDHLTKVTYSELKTLRDDGELVPGMFYRITDYQCTTTQSNTQSAGHQFDIVLLALSENKLSEEGWAMMNESNVYDVTFADDVTLKCWIFDTGYNDCNVVRYDNLVGITQMVWYINDDGGDVNLHPDTKTAECSGATSSDLSEEDIPYNYFQNSKLEAWKVWYCLDNDTARFAWADDSVDDKAKITSTIMGSEIIFVRDIQSDIEISNTEYYAWTNESLTKYTLSETPQVNDTLYNDDGSTYSKGHVETYVAPTNLPNGRGVIYRLIDEFNNDIKYDFKNIQFKRTITDGAYDANGTETWCYTLNLWANDTCKDASIFGNTLAFDSYIAGVYANNFGYCTAYNLSSGPNSFAFALGDNVILSVDDGYGYYIGMYSNTIGNNFHNNTISGDFFHENKIGDVFTNNIIDNSFYVNTIGNEFRGNTIGDSCSFNTIGNDFGYNTVGSNFYFNTIGNGFRNNTIGDFFKANTVGNAYFNNIISKNYIQYCQFEDGIEYTEFTSSATTSPMLCLQNIRVCGGIAGTGNTRRTITHTTVNDTFKTTYQPASSQTVSV